MSRPVKPVPGTGSAGRRTSVPTSSFFSASCFGPISVGTAVCVLGVAGYFGWGLISGSGSTATVDELRTASMCVKVNLSERFQFRATGPVTHKDLKAAEEQCAFVAGSETLQLQLEALGQSQPGLPAGVETTPEPVEPPKVKK